MRGKCVDNRQIRVCGKIAGSDREFKTRVSKQIHTNMASRFKNRLSNGRFGKTSMINTGISKEKLHLGLNSWRDEPPPKLPRLINTRSVTVRKKQL